MDEAVKHTHELANGEIESLHAANVKLESDLLNSKGELEALQLKLVCGGTL